MAPQEVNKKSDQTPKEGFDPIFCILAYQEHEVNGPLV